MLDDLNELRTFERILSCGSLSAAARDLGVTLAVVSKRLATLERRAGVRLVHRTTRSLSPTSDGQALLVRVSRMLAELREAEEALAGSLDEPRGLLRVSAPVSLGRAHVGPVLGELTARHSRLSVELRLENRLVDLVSEGIDVAVRIGVVRDIDAIVRKLADNRRILVAAPSYIQSRGEPETPADLTTHACLRHDDVSKPWSLVGPEGQSVDVEVAARLHTNSGDAARDWALAGLGISFRSEIDVLADLHRGRLVRILAGWASAPVPISALFPSARQLPSKTRVFVEAISQALSGTSTACAF